MLREGCWSDWICIKFDIGFFRTNGIHSDGLFEGVDWGSTRAYAVGLTSLYMKLVAWK